MPMLIPRSEGLERIARERGAEPCLMCAIVERKVGEVHVLYEDDEQLVSLPRYVRKWGQVTVTPKAHVTQYVDVDLGVWARTNELAHRAARIVEQARRPSRTILASTGSSAGELINSSIHLHVHVIPLYDTDDRPADVFSWQQGIFVAEPEEWASLLADYRALW
jgi:diadenosine tetraphosphate (Ap4A) HIT family hydrolase